MSFRFDVFYFFFFDAFSSADEVKMTFLSQSVSLYSIPNMRRQQNQKFADIVICVRQLVQL